MKTENEPIDLGLLSQMVAYIPADQPREEWAKILMAAKSEFGDSAREVMREWSATASSYSKTGFSSTWKSIRGTGGVTIATLIHEARQNGFKFAPISNEDKNRLKAEQKRRQAERKRLEQEEAERIKEGHRMAKEKALKFINGLAFPANPNHPYFVNRGVSDLLGGFNTPLQFKESIIVPAYQFKTPPKQHIDLYEWEKIFEVETLQFINPNRDKLFLKGSNKKGSFFPLRFSGHIVQIVICEGISTAITYGAIYDRESEIIAAFDASNLKPVAKAFKARYPMARIIIAGDNDRFNKDGTPATVNKGIKAATEAAKAVDGLVVWPEFSPHESGTDWNDRYLLDSTQQAKHWGSGEANQLGGINE